MIQKLPGNKRRTHRAGRSADQPKSENKIGFKVAPLAQHLAVSLRLTEKPTLYLSGGYAAP
jgi:hypothetical protein